LEKSAAVLHFGRVSRQRRSDGVTTHPPTGMRRRPRQLREESSAAA